MAPSWTRSSKLRPTRFIVLSVLIIVVLWRSFRSKPVPPPELPPVPTYEVWGIGNMEANIKLSSLQVETRLKKDYQTPIQQKVDVELDFVDADVTNPLRLPALPALGTTVTVQQTDKADASNIIFGMGTKLDRLRDALPALSHWASGSNAQIIALIPLEKGEAKPSKAEVTELYQQRDIKITIIESELDYISQMMALPGIIYDHAVKGKTKWACIMDDDTYFFSIRNLQKMLDKYKSSDPYYVGGISENRESWHRLGYFAYGGAGIFLSMPLLEQLRPRIDECVALPDPAGDERLATCIMNFTTTKFTWDHKLFQVDLHGDVTGFYEAPRERPVSTHHWKSWHHHDMAQVGEVSKVCGSECVLQKYTTTNGWMITNGFSVIKYSYTEEELDRQVPGAMEHTWEHTAWVIPNSWKYTLYPLKPKDPGKIQYIIEKSVETETDVTQYYVWRQEGRGKGIIRMMWTM